jgi:DME family drug/metabolite transporter
LVGTTLAVLAAVAFALSNTSASLAYHGGSNPLTIAAIRFFVPTIMLIVWMRMSGVPLILPARDGLIAVALGFLTALYSWALLTSLNQIPLALATLVFYLFPFLAVVILGFLGWEKFSWQGIVTIAVAFAGLALVLEPRGGDIKIGGLALAFASAFGFALVVTVSSRVFKAGDARPLTLNIAVVSAVLLSALCAARGDFVLPHTNTGWIGFVSTPLLYGIAMISFYIAVSMIGPVRTSLLSYVEPVVAASLGMIILDEALTAVQFAGIALVIIALIAATARRRLATK